jgi:hypothetical protein
MLSLVLIVIIVGNVVLWSYQMNQLDLERMQETVNITNVTRSTRSSWFTAQKEFSTIAGSKLSGTYTDTKNVDDSYESFREEAAQSFNPSNYSLDGSTNYVSGDLSNLNLNDNAYMNFRSYPNYEIKYQENIGVSSTTSTTYQDKVVISFTPQTTASFVILATAEAQGSSTSYQARVQLVVNSGTYQELRYRVKDTTDWYPFCGLKRLTLDGGTAYSIKIQFCTSNSAATASIRNARILILSLQSEYAESEALSTTSNTNWEDKVTLSFTPTTNEDYFIIATANYRGSATNRDVNIRLIQDDTVIHTDTIGRPGSDTTASYYTFGVMRRITLNATSHNFKIQYCSSATPGIAGINYAHIVAIRLSQFDVNYYTESEAESIPGASNTWYDKVVNTYSANAGDYLIMGSISCMSGSTSYSVGLDFQTESTSRQLPLVEHRASTTYESAFFLTKQTLSAGSKTDKIRWMGESTNARVKNARLISCKLSTLTQTVEVEFTGSSNIQSWMQLEWTIDSSFTTADVPTTFQLYNFQTGQYPTSGDGYMTETVGTADVTKNQTITISSTNFRDIDGKWKIKIKGAKATDTQFELKADLIEFKATATSMYRLNINNDFTIALSTYPLKDIHGFEILIRYNVTENAEKWFLKAYNWSTLSFSDIGFNDTGGNQPALNEWNMYAINVTGNWMNYVKSDGTLLVEFLDEGLNTNQTTVEIDFLGIRAIIDGTSFDLKNSSPLTSHIIAIWIINATNHQRYDANLFINSGEELTYIRADISLPTDDFTVKAVTERGNIAVFAGK